jgi:hypothetical protein
MKKIFAIVSLILGVLCFKAHNTSAQANYNKGDVLLNFGLGFAGYYHAGGVPFIASAEFAISDVFSIGPYLGFTSYRYRYYYVNSYRYSYTFIDVGVRASYHFHKHLNLNTNKLDLYGTASLGYTASSYSGDYTGPYADPYGDTARLGLVGGARYYFTRAFSVNSEIGYGLSPVLMGISFKL